MTQAYRHRDPQVTTGDQMHAALPGNGTPPPRERDGDRPPLAEG
ncbi:MAG TPA: hypothetical protein VHJ17_10390 [Thermomonospora sp.]|nr:hypothetical protein [Thermomonospora sp.]